MSVLAHAFIANVGSSKGWGLPARMFEATRAAELGGERNTYVKR